MTESIRYPGYYAIALGEHGEFVAGVVKLAVDTPSEVLTGKSLQAQVAEAAIKYCKNNFTFETACKVVKAAAEDGFTYSLVEDESNTVMLSMQSFNEEVSEVFKRIELSDETATKHPHIAPGQPPHVMATIFLARKILFIRAYEFLVRPGFGIG